MPGSVEPADKVPACYFCFACADLLAKLSGERTRWGEQLQGLDGQLAALPRTALAAAAFITYLPSHPEDVRERIMQGWTRCVPQPGCEKVHRYTCSSKQPGSAQRANL